MSVRVVHLPVSPELRRLGGRLRLGLVAVVLAFGVVATAVGVRSAAAAEAPVGLGAANSFAVLAGSTVTNTGPSVVTGDLGVSPGTAVTGFPPGLVNGTIHSADAVALQAKADLVTAYNDAASRATTATVTADLGGQTLVSGVYTGSTLSLTGALTLNAQGNPNAVFILRSASTLITASASRVFLSNGANPCNVYWQVGSSATLGTGSVFVGTTMAMTSITATTGATITGRLLARSGATTLDSNVITRPSCAAATTTTTTTTSRPTSPSSSPTSPSSSPTAPTGTAPTTTGLTPTSGPTAGGTTVTVTGTGFVPGATSVTIGDVVVPAARVTVAGPTSLSFVTPAHVAGAVNVRVSTPHGTSTPRTFRYVSSPSATTTVPVPGFGAPDTGAPGTANPLNGLVALGLLAAGAGVAIRLRRRTGLARSAERQ